MTSRTGRSKTPQDQAGDAADQKTPEGVPKGLNFYVDVSSPLRAAANVLDVVDELARKHPSATVTIAAAQHQERNVHLTFAVNLGNPTRSPLKNRATGAAAAAFLSDMLDNLHQYHPRTAPPPPEAAQAQAKGIREVLEQARAATTRTAAQPVSTPAACI